MLFRPFTPKKSKSMAHHIAGMSMIELMVTLGISTIVAVITLIIFANLNRISMAARARESTESELQYNETYFRRLFKVRNMAQTIAAGPIVNPLQIVQLIDGDDRIDTVSFVNTCQNIPSTWPTGFTFTAPGTCFSCPSGQYPYVVSQHRDDTNAIVRDRTIPPAIGAAGSGYGIRMIASILCMTKTDAGIVDHPGNVQFQLWGFYMDQGGKIQSSKREAVYSLKESKNYDNVSFTDNLED